MQEHTHANIGYEVGEENGGYRWRIPHFGEKLTGKVGNEEEAHRTARFFIDHHGFFEGILYFIYPDGNQMRWRIPNLNLTGLQPTVDNAMQAVRGMIGGDKSASDSAEILRTKVAKHPG